MAEQLYFTYSVRYYKNKHRSMLAMTEKLWDTSPQKFEELFDRYSDYPKGIIIKNCNNDLGCKVFTFLA